MQASEQLGTEIMYTIRQLLDDREVAVAKRIRAQVYCFEKGWISTEELTRDTDGYWSESDLHDDQKCVHVGAFDGAGEMVGTLRIILPVSELPVEYHFGIRVPPRSAEVSRLAVHAGHRKGVAALGMYAWMIRYLLTEGYDFLYAIAERVMIRQLRLIGMNYEVIGDGRHLYQTFNYPTQLDVARARDAFAEKDKWRPFKLAAVLDHTDLEELVITPSGISVAGPSRRQGVRA